ncbi:hypothetical protein jhhlp_000493 [Lomentospora prolificans]|uniref:Amidase domain-containing protein n=1 Tax=Lomentospora prolificans TaxID=41688 RepID=A0A2N3NL78_9PEZI|nr:hypothetical protein jhhlp_000493 [Lomentospora prolificans]
MATTSVSIDAKPYAFTFAPSRTALVLIDMQRDFLLPGGFGEFQGSDLSMVQACVEPTRKLLEACRAAGLTIFHTREGHRPDMADCPSSKITRQAETPGTERTPQIGEKCSMGRLLIRGEYGHDLIDDLQPIPGEMVIDKPGKGAFWDTDLMHRLKAHGITHLVLGGVTTECCVSTTFREANDRGFECCVVVEATAGYNASFKTASLDMLYWANGLFGFVANLQSVLEGLSRVTPVACSDTETPPQTPPGWDGKLDIASLQAAYRAGVSPLTVVESVYSKIDAYESINPGSWIHRVAKSSALEAARELVRRFPDRSRLPPLFCVPFSVKDSIDMAGLPTTTACPPLSNIPSVSAPVIPAVLDQGALFVGKSNLDQLATGLTGQRSPYGACSSTINPKYICGGSSSGSSVQVGANLVSFSIGTDTAGSGRVPAAFNGIFGFKPTRGTVPCVGVTPACMSLDCIAVLASTARDARAVWRILETFDPQDPYTKPSELRKTPRLVNSIGAGAKAFRFGIPPASALSLCSAPYRRLFAETVSRLQAMGGKLQPINWEPFEKAGELLYDGTFVLERVASIPDLPGSGGLDGPSWFEKHKSDLHPVISELFGAVINRKATAVDVFRDLQAQRRYTAQAHNEIFTQAASGVDIVVVPTAPTHWTIDEVKADPIAKNSALGIFTHCGNVLDLCAISCPAGTFDAKELGGEGVLPFGIMFMGGSGGDCDVLDLAIRFEDALRAQTT